MIHYGGHEITSHTGQSFSLSLFGLISISKLTLRLRTVARAVAKNLSLVIRGLRNDDSYGDENVTLNYNFALSLEFRDYFIL